MIIRPEMPAAWLRARREARDTIRIPASAGGFMVKALKPGALETINGLLSYHPVFSKL